jgi:hypothetical protein
MPFGKRTDLRNNSYPKWELCRIRIKAEGVLIKQCSMEPESWKGADTTQYNKYTPTAIIEQNGLFAYGYIGV